MKDNSTLWTIVGSVIFIAAVMGGIIWIGGREASGRDLSSFAQCINNSGAKFYGAFWCPHCLEQKALFGRAAKLLPYEECSTPSRQQNQMCTDKGVKLYPTWYFGEEQIEGKMTLEQLSEKTNCELPKDDSVTPVETNTTATASTTN